MRRELKKEFDAEFPQHLHSSKWISRSRVMAFIEVFMEPYMCNHILDEKGKKDRELAKILKETVDKKWCFGQNGKTMPHVSLSDVLDLLK